MKLVRTALAAMVVVLAISAAAAQSGGLTVLVVDSNGPLPGATVTISHEIGLRQATTAVLTNATGRRRVPRPAAGQGLHRRGLLPGLRTSRRYGDLHVKINETTPLTVQLAEEIVERVKVVAKRDVVDLEKTTPSSKFSDEFIQDLPVPGRFYQNVLTLAPGVQDADGDGNPNVHGSRQPRLQGRGRRRQQRRPADRRLHEPGQPQLHRGDGGDHRGRRRRVRPGPGRLRADHPEAGQQRVRGRLRVLLPFEQAGRRRGGRLLQPARPGFDWYQPSVQVSGPIVKDKLWYRLSHELIDQERPGQRRSAASASRRASRASTPTRSPGRSRRATSWPSSSSPTRWTIDNFGISSLTPMESAQRLEADRRDLRADLDRARSRRRSWSRAAWPGRISTPGSSPRPPASPTTACRASTSSRAPSASTIETGEVSGSFFRTRGRPPAAPDRAQRRHGLRRAVLGHAAPVQVRHDASRTSATSATWSGGPNIDLLRVHADGRSHRRATSRPSRSAVISATLRGAAGRPT